MCPADAGLAKCERRPESLTSKKHLPFIHTPPRGKNPPAACRRTFTSFQADDAAIKYMNSRLVGSWEHSDRYNGSRSRNEAFHAHLVDPTRASLHGDRIQVFGMAAHGLIAAIAVSVTNIYLTQSHDRAIAANGGVPPFEDRRKQRDLRQSIIRQLRKNRRTL